MAATSSSKQTSILSFMSSPLVEFNKLKPLATSTPMVAASIPKVNPLRRRKMVEVVEKDRNQMILDAGQKNIGLNNCKECGMIYNVDILKDVDAHENYHNRFEKTKWFNVDNRSTSAWIKKLFNKRLQGEVKGIVIQLKSEDVSTLRVRVENVVKECIDPQLGIADDVPTFAKDRKKDAFVFIADATTSRKQLLGACVIVERVLNCKLMPNRSIFQARDGEHGFISIERLWVHPTLRMQNVATHFLDCIRQVMSPVGFEFLRTRIAFCDPTTSGITFAMKYLNAKPKRDKWIAYDPDNTLGSAADSRTKLQSAVKQNNVAPKRIKRETDDPQPSKPTHPIFNFDENMYIPTVTITENDDGPPVISMKRLGGV